PELEGGGELHRQPLVLCSGGLLGHSEGASPPLRASPPDAVRAPGRPRAGPRASEASYPELASAKPALEQSPSDRARCFRAVGRTMEFRPVQGQAPPSEA